MVCNSFVTVLVVLFLIAAGDCKRRRKPRPKHAGTDGCIFDQPDGPIPLAEFEQQAKQSQGGSTTIKSNQPNENSLWANVWIEKLPNQTVVYDRYGNVVQKVHYWETGCRMIVEKCKLQGSTCEPGSGQKWRFGGCDWDVGSLCKPRRKGRFNGRWEPWPPTAHQCAVNCAHAVYTRPDQQDHTYAG